MLPEFLVGTRLAPRLSQFYLFIREEKYFQFPILKFPEFLNNLIFFPFIFSGKQVYSFSDLLFLLIL